MMRGDGVQQPGLPPGIPPDKAAIVAQIQEMFPSAHIQVASSQGATAAEETDDRLDALERLARLHATGALTDAEFAAEKRRILE